MSSVKSQLTIGFSPCPNDTFIFDALVNKKIATQGIELNVILEDVQTLNEWAKKGKLDITKVSCGVLPFLSTMYNILNSGSALGKGVGPLLIAHSADQSSNIENSVIAIPGENTTANFLFSNAYPNAMHKVFMRFDQIEDFVLQQKGLGVIIHENRFTYQRKGLIKLMDLGDHWEKTMQLPIPLGCIVIKKNIDIIIQQKVDQLIRESLQYAFDHYPDLSEYVKNHAQEMEPAVMRQHIDLYVNDYSLDLGKAGKNAILHMLSTMDEKTAHSATFVS